MAGRIGGRRAKEVVRLAAVILGVLAAAAAVVLASVAARWARAAVDLSDTVASSSGVCRGHRRARGVGLVGPRAVTP